MKQHDIDHLLAYLKSEFNEHSSSSHVLDINDLLYVGQFDVEGTIIKYWLLLKQPQKMWVTLEEHEGFRSFSMTEEAPPLVE